jgi:hypothetical protein
VKLDDQDGFAGGDLDGDGLPDLVFTNMFTNVLGVLINQGSRTFAPPVAYATVSGPRGVAVLDADGDGKQDVVVAATGGLQTFLGTGGGVLVAGALSPTSHWGAPLSTFDLDGDGATDIALESGTVMRNVGGGAFHEASWGNQTMGHSQLAAADLDGDGHVDVATPAGAGWVPMYSVGGTLLSAELSLNYGTTSDNFDQVALVDLDGDQRPELVTTAGGIEVSVRKNLSAGSLGVGSVSVRVSGAIPASVLAFIASRIEPSAGCSAT